MCALCIDGFDHKQFDHFTKEAASEMHEPKKMRKRPLNPLMMKRKFKILFTICSISDIFLCNASSINYTEHCSLNSVCGDCIFTTQLAFNKFRKISINIA